MHLISNIDSCSSAYRAVRYISWNDLTAANVSLEAVYFTKIQSSNIKEARAPYVSGNTIELTCYVPAGTTSVTFPTWSDKNGQDDLIWYNGNLNNGVGSIRINIRNHKNDTGSYITHVYAYDKYNNLIDCKPVYVNIN